MKGTQNIRTRVQQASALNGIAICKKLRVTPVEIICTVMAGGAQAEKITDRQYRAAVDAAPYIHPKLQAVAVAMQPDAGTERRRSLLAALPYHTRREITAILEAAELADANGAIGRVVEAIAEQPDDNQQEPPDAE